MKYFISPYPRSWTKVPLVLFIYRLIIDNIDGNKNPGDNEGRTPLHYAAMAGHVNICECILDNIEDKNPETISLNGLNDGVTPFEDAVISGKLEVCKLIIGYLENKNPYSSWNQVQNQENTLLHIATDLGHLEICKLIIDNIKGDS